MFNTIILGLEGIIVLKTKNEEAAGSAVERVAVRKRAWRNRKGDVTTVWVVDFMDEQGRRTRRQFDSRKEADAFRGETESQLRSGTYRAEADRVTVKEAAIKFLAYCRGRMERRERMTRHNLDTLTGHVRNYICPEPNRSKRTLREVTCFEAGLAGVKLRQLSSRAVGDFRDRLRAAGLSVPMTRKVLGTLRLILGYAISQDLVAINVAQGVRVIGRRDEGSKVITAPSKEAVRMLLAAADPDFRIVILFAALTGLRASEMHALRWRHIDLTKGEVRVETRVDEYGEEDFTKTVAGLRTVPVGERLIAALREWRQRSFYSGQGDLVFPGRCGGYQNHSYLLRKRFGPLFEAAREMHKSEPDTWPTPPQRFNWHALRHFAISCWIEAGLSPKTIQTFAGHSSLELTMDRYGHLFGSDDHRTVMDKVAASAFA